MKDKLILLEKKLNAESKLERMSSCQVLLEDYREGTFPWPEKLIFVNNHIHTDYSFSPYSPTSAAYTAWKNGLQTAGIVDHDSVAGVREFIEASECIGIAATSGFEIRCRMDETPFAGKRINNTDQDSIAYVVCHGLPHQSIEQAEAWIAPYRSHREERNRAMVGKINALLPDQSLHLDYDQDVRSLSKANEGGSVTERHILFALSKKMVSFLGKGEPVLAYLKDVLRIEVTGRNLESLTNPETPDYEYYLLGALKGNLVEQFYINATDECPTVAEFIAFALSLGGVPAYAYLGDVGDSVTGDKATQAFEDAYLDELIPWLSEAGFQAVTYMPSRNTSEQLERLMGLIDQHGLFQISGEDINTPFQSFHCKALEKPQFQHLITNTWALIGHEHLATQDIHQGMFTKESIKLEPDLAKRIQAYAKKAQDLFA